MLEVQIRCWCFISNDSAWLQQCLEQASSLTFVRCCPGTRTIAGDGKLSWPNIRLESLCGGAPGWDSRWDTPGPVGHAIYVKGQVIDIDVLVAVNHLVSVRQPLWHQQQTAVVHRYGLMASINHFTSRKQLMCNRSLLLLTLLQGRFEFKLCSIAARPGDAPNCHQLQRCVTLDSHCAQCALC